AVLGNFFQYTEPTIRRESKFRFTNLEWYAQDTWRLNRKFTLDYGVRIYWHPPETETSAFMSSGDIKLFDRSKAVRLYLPAAVNGTLSTCLAATGAVLPGNSNRISGDGNLATTMNYSIGVQRRSGKLFAIDIAYAASLARHLPEVRDYNTLPPAARFLKANEN